MSPAPPRAPAGSADSFRPVTEDQGEKILIELGGVEGRFLAHLATVHQDVQELRPKVERHEQDIVELKRAAVQTQETNQKIDALGAAVKSLDESNRALAASDLTQYQQLAALQQARAAGGKWGAVVSLIVSLILGWLAQRYGLPLPLQK